MSDPHRWIDDPATSSRLRAALQQYPRPSAIPIEALQAFGTVFGDASSTVHGTASAAPGTSVGLASAAPGTSVGAASATLGTSVGAASATVGALLGTAALTKAGLLAVVIGLGGAGWCALKSKTENAVPVVGASVVVAEPPANTAPAAFIPVSPVESLELVDQTAEDAPRTRDHSGTTSRPTETAETASVARRSHEVPSEPERLAQRTGNAKPDKSQLQQEVALLELGRKLLSTDPSRALEQTALHRERFATPMLGLERDLLEMDALCRLGNATKAERIAKGLLRVQPVGPYAERARAILARANRNQSLEGVKDRKNSDNQ